jgi:hypothetical protein
MTNTNDRGPRGEVRHADPDRAATDPRAAAQQEQVKADHDRLEESARRVDASTASGGVATDREAAAKQDRVKADHDALQDSARRVEASVPADVRDTPVQPANFTRGADEARANADAMRDSVRRVDDTCRKTATATRGNAGIAVPAYAFPANRLRKCPGSVASVRDTFAFSRNRFIFTPWRRESLPGPSRSCAP